MLDVPRTVTRTFDVIYMLNAFYAFDRQRDALAGLRKVAKPGAQLVIFDYTVGANAERHAESDDAAAIRLSEIAAMLREAGWAPGAVEDLNVEYARWYATFVERIQLKRAEIEKIGGVDWYNFVFSMYSGLHGVIASGGLGGAIVHAARRSDPSHSGIKLEAVKAQRVLRQDVVAGALRQFSQRSGHFGHDARVGAIEVRIVRAP